MGRERLGERMKERYEKPEAGRRFPRNVPVVIRLDGKGFSRYTSHMDRPFDIRMITAMQRVTERLMQETRALVGYTQSDEITLILHTDTPNGQVYFDGRVQKIVSVLAAIASVTFNYEIGTQFPGTLLPPAYFDCRAHTVPNKTEAANAVLWRQQDAMKNSTAVLAHHYFSHDVLQRKNSLEMRAMVEQEHGVRWEDFPMEMSHGTMFRRETVHRVLTDEERERIAEAHRPGPDEVVARNTIERVALQPYDASIAERVAFIFGEPADTVTVKSKFPMSVTPAMV
jgi:tRNA(His) guanylyltransferase